MITKTPPEVLSPSDLAYMSTLNERDRRWFLATKAADLKTQGLSYRKVSKIILDFFDIRDGRNGSANFEMDLYTLQFRWIPSLIDAVVKGNLPCQALADVPWWEKCLKEQGMTKADFSFEEIKAEIKKISEEKGRICLTFPYPKCAPLAKYAVIDLLASGRTNYYTLEMSLDDTWVLGSQDVHRHSYIRQVPDCQQIDFQRLQYNLPI